jgi:hypothetical protein
MRRSRRFAPWGARAPLAESKNLEFFALTGCLAGATSRVDVPFICGVRGICVICVLPLATRDDAPGAERAIPVCRFCGFCGF